VELKWYFNDDPSPFFVWVPSSGRRPQIVGTDFEGSVTRLDDFSYIFSGENFGENSAENFPQKMLEKLGFSAKLVLKNRFFN
jgi:hypothetical protein